MLTFGFYGFVASAGAFDENFRKELAL